MINNYKMPTKTIGTYHYNAIVIFNVSQLLFSIESPLGYAIRMSWERRPSGRPFEHRKRYYTPVVSQALFSLTYCHLRNALPSSDGVPRIKRIRAGEDGEPNDLKKIINTYINRTEEERYSRCVKMDEIKDCTVLVKECRSSKSIAPRGNEHISILTSSGIDILKKVIMEVL